MAAVVLEGVRKTFPGEAAAVRDLSLEVADGELMVLVGPSGCGKSTALRLIAGLEAATGGTVRIDGRAMDQAAPGERDVAMVFQNYALYPHMSVRGNLEFPLRMRGARRAERRRRAEETAELLGITELLERRPPALSGGQRQRVAMGRALVREPAVFLMDEPLSNLDARLRVRIRGEIAALQRRLGATTIYVTHDQAEAMTLGDRVAVLRDGALQQVDTPAGLYAEPANAFVAAFLGTPGMNLLRARSGGRVDAVWAELGQQRVRLPAERCPERLRRGDGVEFLLGIRPEGFRPVRWGSEDDVLRLKVRMREYLGHETLLYLEPPGPALDPEVPESSPPLVVRIRGEAPPPGEILQLQPDPRGLRFFAPDGARLE
ncbi:ABC transporter ATP-binding protein [Thiohalorhabdus sp. Cl-TMA]|uniref:ABC transporter ATP-binding protein n=1 Tax=Thiohalorhabdus methylotrophus TaxID=3242694 RepID=A0ABV4TS78_9GAMM